MNSLSRLTIVGLALLVLCACGGPKEKPIIVTGQNGVVYESYQEACTAQDFVAAHQYLDRMRGAASNMSGSSRKDRELKSAAERRIDEAVEYITNKEILLLMSLDDETAYNRITFLLKENDFSDFANDSYCDKVIDLAIDMDKPMLVQRMTNFYKGNISEDMLKKIVEYLYVRKGEDNLPFVTSLLNRYDKNELLLSAAIEKGDQALVVKQAQGFGGKMSVSEFKRIMEFLESANSPQYRQVFTSLADHVEGDIWDYAIDKNQVAVAKKILLQMTLDLTDKTIISKLASLGDKQCSDIILQSLVEKGRSVPSMPSIRGYVKSSSYGKMDEYTLQGQYNIEAKKFNDECLSIVSVAISNRNTYLAKGAIAKMKPTLQFTEVGDWVKVVEKKYNHSSLYNAFKVSLCYDDINAAKQSLNVAF